MIDNVRQRISNILDDREVVDGSLRVLVNDATNVITFTVDPNAKKPEDHYDLINAEEL